MRGKQAKKREPKEDVLFESLLVERLINMLMLKGKKSIAEKIVYEVLADLDDDRAKALALLQDAIRNVAPQEEVRSRRVGGATYQVPIPVNRDRSTALALRWIIDAARDCKGVSMQTALLSEVQDAVNGAGTAMRKKENVQRMAEANRAFAYFRW